MKNNRLSIWTALAAVVLAVHSGGCAYVSEQVGPERGLTMDADAPQATALTTHEGTLGGVTRFTEDSIDSLATDNFWGSDLVAQRDSDGRLTYVGQTRAKNNPEIMRQELADYEQRSFEARARYGRVPLSDNAALFFMQNPRAPNDPANMRLQRQLQRQMLLEQQRRQRLPNLVPRSPRVQSAPASTPAPQTATPSVQPSDADTSRR